MSNTPSNATASPKRSKLKLALLIVAGGTVALGLGIILLGPTIASSVAPGIINSAAKGKINGTLTVSNVSLSWTGPISIGSIELKDPAGQVVALLSVESSMGILKALGGIGDLGTLKLGGNVDVISTVKADGSRQLNLLDAVATPPGTTPGPLATAAGAAAPTKLPPQLAAVLDITGINITYAEKATPTAAAVKQASIDKLKGLIRFAAAGPKGGTASIELDSGLSSFVGSAPSTPGAMKVRAVIDGITGADGALTIAKAKTQSTIDITGLPMGLVDALADQNGLLSGAIGQSLTLKAGIDGDMQNATASIDASASNLTAAGAVKIASSRLTLDKPIYILIKDTSFIAALPAGKRALDQAGISVTTYPSINLAVTKLDLPTDPAADMSAGVVDIALSTTATSGTVAQASTTTGTKPAARNFTAAPLTINLSTARLADGVSLTGGTSAMLDGASAGKLTIIAKATGLLDPAGKPRTAGPDGIDANIAIDGFSTTLIQPFITAAGAPLRLSEDVGPTLQLSAKLNATGMAGPTSASASTATTAAARKATADLTVSSQNLTVAAPLSIDGDLLTSRGTISLKIAKVSGALGRILADRAADSGITTSGDGQVDVTITDLRYLLTPAKPATAAASATSGPSNSFGPSGKIAASISDLTVSMLAAPSVAVTAAGATPQPVPAGQPATERITVRLDALSFSAALASSTTGAATGATTGPAALPKIDINGRLIHTGLRGPQVITILGDIASPVVTGATELPSIGSARLVGNIAINDVPAELLRKLSKQTATAQGLFDGLLGDTINITLATASTATEQNINLTVVGRGADNGPTSASIKAALGAEAIKLGEFKLTTNITDAVLRGGLQFAGANEADLNGARLSGPAKVQIDVTPMSIPLARAAAGNDGKPGKFTLSPDFARSTETAVATVTVGDVAVSGAKIGDQIISGGLKNVAATGKLPLKSLAPNKTGTDLAEATLSATIIRDNATVATLAGSGKFLPDGSSIDGTLSLKDIDGRQADTFLGKPGYITGAIGDTGNVTITAKRSSAAAPLAVTLAAITPKLKAEDLALTMDQTAGTVSITAGKPITWAADGKWLSDNLLAPKPAAATSAAPAAAPTQLTVTNSPNISVAIRSLKFALPKPESAPGRNDGTGPLKPGVFAMDIGAEIDRLTADVKAASARQPDKLDLSGISIKLSQDTPGTIALASNIKSLVSAPAAAALAPGAPRNAAAPVAPAPQTITDINLGGTAVNLADGNGNIKADAARFNLTFVEKAIPTAFLALLGVDSVSNLENLLGKILNVSANATNVSTARPVTAPGANVATATNSAPGLVEAKLQSDRTAFRAKGRIENGTLIFSAADPLIVRLSEFTVLNDSQLMKTIPIFGTLKKPAPVLAPGAMRPAKVEMALPKSGEVTGDAVITSSNLRVPIDGDMSKLNGDIAVDFGVVQVGFAGFFANALSANARDLGLSETAGAPAPRFKPFAIRFVNGVGRYDGIEIPVVIGGSSGAPPIIKLNGGVDLVKQTINATVDLPGPLASDSLFAEATSSLRGLNSLVGGGLNKILNEINKAQSGAVSPVLNEIIVPIRISGPLSNPTTSVDADRFGQLALEFVPRILGRLGLGLGGAAGGAGDLLGGLGESIGGLLGGDKNKPAPAPAGAPKPAPTPAGAPKPAAAPAPPAKPAATAPASVPAPGRATTPGTTPTGPAIAPKPAATTPAPATIPATIPPAAPKAGAPAGAPPATPPATTPATPPKLATPAKAPVTPPKPAASPATTPTAPPAAPATTPATPPKPATPPAATPAAPKPVMPATPGATPPVTPPATTPKPAAPTTPPATTPPATIPSATTPPATTPPATPPPATPPPATPPPATTPPTPAPAPDQPTPPK